jgi:hypothetical protein
VYRNHEVDPIFTATTGTGGLGVMPHGVALSADGSHLFAVTIDDSSNDTSFWAYDLPQAPKAPSTTSVSPSVNPSLLGQFVTVTATVQPPDAFGTVAFYSGGLLVGACNDQFLVSTSSGAQATCNTLPAIGTHSLTAVYNGDLTHLGSFGTTTQTVMPKLASTTTLSSSPNPSLSGQPVSLTATVQARTPTGSVAFFAGGQPIPGCSAVQVTQPSFNATCVTTSLPVGTDSLSAVYSGDAFHLGSSGTSSQGVQLDVYRDRMQSVRDTLDGYRKANPQPKSTYDRVTAALADLDKALNTPGLWQSDGRHLTSKGGAVFDATSGAVNDLLGIAQPRPAAVTGATSDIVGIDHLIATLEYNDASVLISSITPTNMTEYKTAQTELSAASAALSKSVSDQGAQRWVAAIGDFKSAWQHSLNALTHASKA